jgi:hypothetical protein
MHKANVMVVVKMIYLELQILAIVEGANLMKKRKKKVKTKFQNSLILPWDMTFAYSLTYGNNNRKIKLLEIPS